jgi:hypothetical protein
MHSTLESAPAFCGAALLLSNCLRYREAYGSKEGLFSEPEAADHLLQIFGKER